MQVNAATFTTLGNLLVLAADPARGAKRLTELQQAHNRAAAAEADLEARRRVFAEHEAAVRAELSRLARSVAQRRDAIEQEEARVAGEEESTIADEEAWAGIAMPNETSLARN